MNTVTAILITQIPIAIACILVAVELRQLKREFVKILQKLVEIANKHQTKK
jgi:hypothetical protein